VCSSDLSCFTACCGNIKIILTPYDILQLCHRLRMPPHEFISEYAEPDFLEQTDMPGVRIKMRADDNRCPFVTPDGCTVYSDRPTACRYYPIGMADFHEGGRKEEGGKEVLGSYDKFYFKVVEEHCKGHFEDKEWTIAEWRADQGVDVRDEMNKEWLRLIMRRKSHGHQASLSEQAQRMFFMASTDLPSFRRFIFESSFFDIYEVDADVVEKIRTDDIELMKFSFLYLASTLFGAQGLRIKEEKVRAKVAEIKQRQDESVLEAIREYEEMKKEMGE
jgi:Fe-S-cluster containining protein